jgi:hypothetical protein
MCMTNNYTFVLKSCHGIITKFHNKTIYLQNAKVNENMLCPADHALGN